MSGQLPSNTAEGTAAAFDLVIKEFPLAKERPLEPSSSSENPESWHAIAEWERERADALKEELLAAKRKIVYGFHEDEVPTYRDGILESHELEVEVTAEHVTSLVKKILELTEKLNKASANQ